MSITVETYTTDNGSNMDPVEYRDGLTLDEVAADLRKCYGNWDYAYVEFPDGSIEMVER